MPFCIQCGTRLEEGARFCTSCGARQPEPAAAASVPRTEDRPAASHQNSYNYDPTIYSGGDRAGNVPSRKKGGTIFFIVLAVLVVLAALIYVFSAVNRGKPPAADSDVLGIYVLQKAETNGITVDAGDLWKNGFTIELKARGRAELNVDGKTGGASWTLEGSKFTIKGSGLDCSGTLKNGTLILRNVMNSGVKLYFTKDGAPLSSDRPSDASASAAPADKTPTPAAPGNGNGPYGKYIAVKAEAFGVEVPVDSMYTDGFSIELQAGGECTVKVNTNSAKGTWTLDGDKVTGSLGTVEMSGALSDGVMILENVYGMGVTFFFSLDGAALPAA